MAPCLTAAPPAAPPPRKLKRGKQSAPNKNKPLSSDALFSDGHAPGAPAPAAPANAAKPIPAVEPEYPGAPIMAPGVAVQLPAHISPRSMAVAVRRRAFLVTDGTVYRKPRCRGRCPCCR